MELEDDFEDLETLYRAVGGFENYEIWDETTTPGKSLEEIIHSLEEDWGREKVGRQRIVDYWSDLHQIGLLDGNWQLNQLGETWNYRVQNSVQSLYRTDADIGDNRKNIGDIFYTLGTPNTLPTLHKLYHDENMNEMGLDVQEPLDVMHQHGFIRDEAYRNADWRPETNILTDKAETVYEEVVLPDYRWIKDQDIEL